MWAEEVLGSFCCLLSFRFYRVGMASSSNAARFLSRAGGVCAEHVLLYGNMLDTTRRVSFVGRNLPEPRDGCWWCCGVLGVVVGDRCY